MSEEKDRQRMDIADQITAFFAEGREVEIVPPGKSGQVKEMFVRRKERYIAKEETTPAKESYWRKQSILGGGKK